MNNESIIFEARKKAKLYKLQGYHCSESVIRTINDVLQLKMNDDVLRCACGFRGGGGGYRDRCGIIEAGIMIISYIYGRDDSNGDLDKYSEMIVELHDDFKNYFNTIYCRDIYYDQKKKGVENTCLEIIVDGVEIILKLLLKKLNQVND